LCQGQEAFGHVKDAIGIASGQARLKGCIGKAGAFRGRPVARILAGQKAPAQRAPWDEADAVGPGHRDQFAFDAPVEDVIGRLLGYEAVQAQLLGGPEGLHDLPGGESAGAEIANFAGAHEIVEGAQGLVDSYFRAGPVHLIDVDVVGLQAFEAGFALFDDMAATAAGGVWIVVVHSAMDFGREDDAATAAVAFQGLAGNLFAAAATVDVCRVQEVETCVQRPVDNVICVFRRGSSAEVHAAQAKGADFHAGPTKITVLHWAPRTWNRGISMCPVAHFSRTRCAHSVQVN